MEQAVLSLFAVATAVQYEDQCLHVFMCPQVQLEVKSQVQAGLSEVQKVGQLSLGLQHSMNRSLEITVSAVHVLKWAFYMHMALKSVDFQYRVLVCKSAADHNLTTTCASPQSLLCSFIIV